MKKAFVLLALVTSGSLASASELAGIWCDVHSDFSDVLAIDANGNLSLQVVGQVESYPIRYGLISRGASSVVYKIGRAGEAQIDQGAVDIIVENGERRTLHIIYPGWRESFVEATYEGNNRYRCRGSNSGFWGI